MKRVTRFLIYYRIYPKNSDRMISQGYFSFYSKRYHKSSLGLIREIERVYLYEEYGYSPETHFLEVVSIKEH